MKLAQRRVIPFRESIKATAGHELLSFMDINSGYNQIKMHLPDENKTAFTIDREIYCYKVMSFRLKNDGVAFQRMVNKVFKDLIRSTMEVYVCLLYTSPSPRDS